MKITSLPVSSIVWWLPVSAKYLFAAMELEFDSPLTQLVFIRIANGCDDDGIWKAKVKTIASKCGCGLTSVRKALNEFERRGYMAIEHRWLPNGVNRSNVDRIVVEVTASVPGRSRAGSRSTRETALVEDLTNTDWAHE